MLFAVILLVNLSFIIFWLYCFFHELKKTLIIKQAWLYRALFVCHKKDEQRFEREQAMMERKVQNEGEVSELEGLIDMLQQVKGIYAEGQALDKDQKFRFLFKRFK